MNELEDMEWLVDRRSKIQALLVRIYSTIGDDLPVTSMGASVKFLLVGVGYSLWRAVFLAESTRDWKTVNEHAKDFLRKLIKDNAIGYPQESATKAWTVGYYLNSAYHRLNRAYHILALDAALRKNVQDFIESQSADGFQPALMEHWDMAYGAATELLENAGI